MRNTGKRILALLLSIVMCVSLLPVPAMAEGTITAGEGGTITMAQEEETLSIDETEPPVSVSEDEDTEEAAETETPAEEEQTAEKEKITIEESETAGAYLASSGTCGDSLTWTMDDDGTLTISGTGTMTNYSGGRAPWYSSRASITAVVIDSEITSVGNSAFYNCTSLTTVTFGSGLQTIGDDAFYGCSSLREAILPEGLTSLGEAAFNNCTSLSKVSLPSTLTTLADGYARSIFGGTALKSAGPAGGGYDLEYAWTNKILWGAFYNIRSLESAVIADGITSIRGYAFCNCTGLKEIEIPDSVTTIEKYAFQDCAALTTVTFGSGLTSIGESAFYNCSSLREAILPEGLTSLGEAAFNNCTKLAKVSLPSTLTTLADGYARSIFGGTALKSAGPTGGGYDLEYGWTDKILWGAFYNIRSLESAVIADGITSIRGYAFCNCTGLKEIEIPDSVTTIEKEAFNSCTSLTTVTFGTGLQTIGEEAFYNCSALTELNVESGLKTIGNNAFYNCTALADVYYTGDEAAWNAISIGSNNENLTRATIHCNSIIISPADLIPQITIDVYGYIAKEDESSFSGAVKADEAAVRSWTWDFGDGTAANGKTAKHIYSSEDTFTVTLTVKDIKGREYQTSRTVTVVDVTEENSAFTKLDFSVVNAGNLSPIRGAQITITQSEEKTLNLRTASDGSASCVVDNGTYTVSVMASDYIVRTISVTADGGVKNLSVGLTRGGIISGELSAREMTYDEIVDAGIDPNAPGNEHVYEFVTTLIFTAGLKEYELPCIIYKNDNDEYYRRIYDFFIDGAGNLRHEEHGSGSGGFPDPPDWLNEIKLTVYPVTEKFALVVYGEAHWLKEMFQVSLLIHNDSLTETLENTSATLVLPDGLSLADMVSAAQTATQELGTVACDGNAGAIWYVRGDKEGEYDLTALVTANLSLGDEITAEFTTTEPIKVNAGSALHMTITAQDMANRGEEYTVRFKLENVSDKSLYHIAFGLKGAEQYKIKACRDNENVEWEPITGTGAEFGEAWTRSVDELAPGGFIELELTTTIWFTSVLELVECTELGAYVDISYYLQDVTVTATEASTTQIPYTIVIERAERESWIDWLLSSASQAILGYDITSFNLGENLVEVVGEELSFPAIPLAQGVLALQQGETDYVMRIRIDDGRADGNSIKNDVVWITEGDIGNAIVDILNGTEATLKTDSATIQIKGPGSTKLYVNKETREGDPVSNYVINLEVDDAEIKDTITLSPEGLEETSVVNKDAMRNSLERILEQELGVLQENPYLWLESGIDFLVEPQRSAERDGFSVNFFNDDGSGGGVLWSETHNRISVSGTTATLEFTREGWSSLAEQSGEDFTIAARQLMDEEKAELGVSDTVYDFSAVSGDETISSFGGGSVVITVPYVLGNTENADDLYVEHFKADGTSEILDATYNAETKTIRFETKSFSYFRIGFEEHETTVVLSQTELNLPFGKTAALTVTDEDGKTVSASWSSSDDEIATVNSKGVVTAKKVGKAVITATVDGMPLRCSVRVQFKDVTDQALFYYEPIYNMVDKGVIGGWEDGTFRPTGNCNRAAVVTFLWKLAGRPEPGQMATFKDMTTNAEFNKAISWAAESGITSGWSDNTFRPWNTCNRAAIVTFLWRYAGKPEATEMAAFSDMPTDNEDFCKAISWAAEKGITTGYDGNLFKPWNTCNRLAVASFLDRYDKLKK